MWMSIRRLMSAAVATPRPVVPAAPAATARLTAVVAVAVLAWAPFLPAQSRSTAPGEVGGAGVEVVAADTAEDADVLTDEEAPRRRSRSRSPWRFSLDAALGSLYDTNLQHRHDGVASFGSTAKVGAGVQRRLGPASAGLAYALTVHRYEEDPTRSRESHSARAVVGLVAGPRVALTVTGDASIGGSSEDREIGNEYGLSPRIDLRLGASQRLRLTAARRTRRYEELGGRDAENLSLGVDYRFRSESGAAAEVGSRFEANRAARASSSFTRWTHRARLTVPLAGALVATVEMKQSSRAYPHRHLAVEEPGDVDLTDRQLEVLRRFGDPDEPGAGGGLDDVPPDVLLAWTRTPRSDHIWTPSAALRLPLGFGVELRTAYRFDGRASNDLRRNYGAHRWALDAILKL